MGDFIRQLYLSSNHMPQKVRSGFYQGGKILPGKMLAAVRRFELAEPSNKQLSPLEIFH